MLLGLDRCGRQPSVGLNGKRLGLLMNRASVDRHLNLSCDVVRESFRDSLRALFTPQHGLWGDAQANMVESNHEWHESYAVPVHSLYSETRCPTNEMLSDLDTMVIDLQDVGTRVYTFIWTMLECLRTCARTGRDVVVLDRPNPLGGLTVEGPLLEEGFQSFVGGACLPMRHALTIGELARLFQLEFEIDVQLDVIPMEGWGVESGVDMDRQWIPPSPNLPRFESALVYPGQVLLEGTNLSEGRGTTFPFEVVGAPFLNADQLCRRLRDLQLPGVAFLPIRFRPTFDKWSGQVCEGVSVHVTERNRFRAYEMTVQLLAVVRENWPDEFRWLDPPYEYETVKPPIDIISGSDRLRRQLSLDTTSRLCEIDVAAWHERVRPALLYPRPWA